MSALINEYTNTTNTRLHGAWMWYKSAERGKWNPVWSVLRDNTLFFFTSDDTSLETHVGTLHLSKDCSFHYRDGSSKDGFRFDVHVARKKKKFRVKTVYERELWRAYLEGVITGAVPQGVVLSPQDVQDITNKLQAVRHVSPVPPRHIQSTPSFTPAYPLRDLRDTPLRYPSLSSLLSTGTGSSSSGGEFDPPGNDSLHDLSIHSRDSGRSSGYFDGGPFMRHRFTTEGDGNPPTWFFDDCSRELAEKILTQSSHMGNTLMRVSWTARNTGSYAISKRMERSGEIEHYEVIRVAEGYKINVENCTQAMKTLSEVMDFFVQLSGATATHPMKYNNLKQLGIDYDEYSRRIVKQQEGVCETQREREREVPSAPSPVDTDSEDGNNYEEPREPPLELARLPPAPAPPTVRPPPVCFPPGSGGPKVQPKTWGRDRGEQESRHGVGLVPKTVGPSGASRADVKPSAMQLNEKLQEQDVIETLDGVLRTEDKREAKRGSSAPSDVPPPLPAVPANRPKLNTRDQPIYQNQRDSRSNSPVPMTATPPNLVMPSGVGGRTPPTTAPKSPLANPLSISGDRKENIVGGVKGPGISVVQELQQKLQLGARLKPVAARERPVSLPSQAYHRQQTSQADAQDDGEMYEDVSQYYQNCS